MLSGRNRLFSTTHSFDVGLLANEGASNCFLAVSVVNSYYIFHLLALHWNLLSFVTGYQRLPLRWDLYLICMAAFCLWRGRYFHDRKKIWDTTAQVTLISLEGKKGGLRRSRRKINAKLHARDNSYDSFISFSLEPTILSKISPSLNCHFISSWFRFIGKAVTVSQVFRKMTSHLLYYIGED